MDQVAAGEDIIIAKAGKPVAKLAGRSARPGCLGGVAVNPPDFEAPLSDHVIDAFEGGWLCLLLDTHVLVWALITPRD